MKTKLFILCIALWGVSGIACADEDFPKFDAAIQMPAMNLRGAVGEEPLGVGGRFGYHFSPHLILDAEMNYFPENPSGNFGETLGMAGFRIGTEFDKISLFADMRAGAVNFGGGDFSLRLKAKTYPAIGLGGMVEYYLGRRLFVRADLGDCIIPFGGTTFQSAYGPRRLGTQHNLLMSFGIGFYF